MPCLLNNRNQISEHMKPLEQLNNVERAKLLHELFKNEIPYFLTFAKNTAVMIREQQEEFRIVWKDQLFTFDFWLQLARETAENIGRYGSRLEKQSRLFSDQLFDGYHALFMAHCLQQYTKVHSTKNEKFTKAIELLFS